MPFPHRTALTRRLALVALGALALLPALPAQAVGRIADLQVIDRDSGETLPIYRHQGEYWIAGRPGARYALQLGNTGGGRVLAVTSVDGVNVVSGETAAWEQTGYVLAPWQRAQITGWRKSDAEVAQFHFTALPRSYAARTGRPDNVGVIGVAVFRERYEPPPPPYPPVAPMPRRRWEPGSGEFGSAAPAEREARAEAASPAAEARAEPRADAGAQATGRAKAMPAPAPSLGTGHGARESSWVTHTAFERRSSSPDEVIVLRYDSRENLVARGVLPAWEPQPRRPLPFPDAPATGYVPDPPH